MSAFVSIINDVEVLAVKSDFVSAEKLITDFQSKALKRCNADDDTRADEFSAQALALIIN